MKPVTKRSEEARKFYLKALAIVLSSAGGAFILATSVMGIPHFF
ncbi:hypothetical protein [Leeia speluncae]|nr:hypothetical protein [Leeia speluncae]